jgi:ornithine cyclodeaminase/alanine dehydrogenase-like protein (mu-crystallin family)
LKPAGTLLLTRRDVASLLDLDRCIAAVEEAFRLRGEGKTPPPGILGFPAAGGKPGRVMPEEVTVFDSTGTVLQDVAAAAAVYEKAMDAGRGLLLDFAG